jgi:hypothetical protein
MGLLAQLSSVQESIVAINIIIIWGHLSNQDILDINECQKGKRKKERINLPMEDSVKELEPFMQRRQNTDTEKHN